MVTVEASETRIPGVPGSARNFNPHHTMKKITLLLALCVSFFALAPSTALADHRHHHSSCERRVAYRCGSCGDSVYQELRLVGYDRCGRPVYDWVNVGHSCHHHHYYRNEISVGGLRFRF